MRLLDLSFRSPAENLAMDEALLEAACAPDAEGVLRLWESPVPFVVLGVTQDIEAEVNREQCRAAGVPVLRRCTAGGCVLQGPGSLNYSLALPFDSFPELRGLHASYAHILGRIGDALQALGVQAALRGISDLAMGELKVSGNAQRRKRLALLHHGTLLYRARYDLMERCLREPGIRPDYRGARTHRDFVGELPLTPETLKPLLASAFGAFGAEGEPDPALLVRNQVLAREKYACL